jgi:hypothetical protein
VYIGDLFEAKFAGKNSGSRLNENLFDRINCYLRVLFTNLSSRSTFFNLIDSGLSGLRFCLDHLIFDDSNLPFDGAQGGELVEPFRISANFIRSGEFRISGLCGLESYFEHN